MRRYLKTILISAGPLLIALLAFSSPVAWCSDTSLKASMEKGDRLFNVASSSSPPPVNFPGNESELTGFGRDVSEAVIHAIGGDANYMHSSRWPEVIQWLETGKADIIHFAHLSSEPNEHMDFTAPILEMPEVIFVRAKQFGIMDLSSLRGKRVACIEGHLTYLYLKQFPEIDCFMAETPLDGIFHLINGDVDAFVYPQHIVDYLVQQYRVRGKVKKVGLPLRSLRWSMAVRKGDHELVGLLNEGIIEIRDSGEYDKIHSKWFGRQLLAGYSKKELAAVIGAAVIISLLSGGFFAQFYLNKKLRTSKQRLEQTIRERDSAEAALGTSEQKYRSLFEQANDAIFLADVDTGTIIDANRNAQRMMGLSWDELVGMNQSELHPPEERELYTKIFKRQVLQSISDEAGTVVGGDLYVQNLSGSNIPVEIGAKVINIGGQKIVQGIFRDITERRQDEEFLRLLKKAIEAVQAGVTITDVDRKIIFTNSAEAEMHGYELDELIGIESRILAPKETWNEMSQSQKAGLDHYDRETVNTRKDGSVFPVHITSVAVRDDTGEVVAFISICQDITEQKISEEYMRRNEERLTGFMDSATESFILFDSGLHVLEINRTALKMFGLRKQEALGLHILELAPVVGPSGRYEKYQEVIKTGEPFEMDNLPFKSAYGDIYLFLKAFRVGNGLGITSTDITGKRAAEEEALRTRHLASLGELAAGVAHEINNPINSIINYAQITHDESGSNSEAAQISGRIIKEGNRIAGIVSSLLSFARKGGEEKVPTSLYEIISDTLALTGAQLRKDGIKLDVNMRPDLPLVVVNQGQIQQVLLNLISNARYSLNKREQRAEEPASIAITASVKSKKGMGYVSLRVRDNGVGIPGDLIDKIMDPFFSTKPLGEGTGLGLSICHGIIKDHGGNLRMESLEEEYAEAILDLPAGGPDER